VDSLAGGATSSATAEEGSSSSQDKSVDFLQKHTQLIVSQPRLLQQVLLAKMQYLQVRLDYCHGRGTKNASNIDQSTLGGRLLLRPCGYRLFCSSGGRRSAILRSWSHHLFNGGGYRLSAPLWSRGLALQLHQELLNSGGWTTTSGWLPHCVPHAFVTLLDGLRWRHLLHTRKTTRQQGYSCNGYSTTLVKTSYLLRRGL
jgi:hypothetical protein